MSRPPAIAAIDIGKLAWTSRINRAQRRWSKLSAADRVEVEGRPDRRAELLHRHDSFGKIEADSEIGAFFRAKV